jgi:hypothetical protein
VQIYFRYQFDHWKVQNGEETWVSEKMGFGWDYFDAEWTKTCVPSSSDAANDFIDSISTNTVTYESSFFDILFVEGFLKGLDIKSDSSDDTFPFECGSQDNCMLVVCPDSVLPMPAGDMVQVASMYAEDVPLADEGHSLIYSAVFDSDGESADDWVYFPPYDWDLFRDTDRWYQLIWDHLNGTWSVTVTQVDSSQNTADVQSTARAVIWGSTINWFISGTEFPSDQPGYRVTSFGHDGYYSANDRGADVSGADPTEPLLQVETLE